MPLMLAEVLKTIAQQAAIKTLISRINLNTGHTITLVTAEVKERRAFTSNSRLEKPDTNTLMLFTSCLLTGQ
jgi:hypothetical protein